MKTYDELYQEYPEFTKEFWEKCKAKDHKRVLFYNSYIKNDSVSDDVIAKRREALERAQDISVGASLISVVVFAIGLLLKNEFIETAGLVIAAIVLFVHLYTDTVLNHIILEKYRKSLLVLSWWCNELENHGFDVSSYRSVISSVQQEADERYFLYPKEKYYDVVEIKKKMKIGEMFAKRDEPLFDQFVEFLTSIIRENFDNYTGTPEDTEMVLKTYTFTPNVKNVKRKEMPSYIKESYELACPVNKAELQNND